MSETLEQRLTRESQEALKNHDARRREILSTILSAVKKARIDAAGKTFGPAEELGVLEKAKKQREESVGLYRQAGREDAAAKELEEIEVIKNYLPEPLTEEAVKQIIADAVAKTGAVTIKDMGKVMGLVQAQTKGRFDAAQVANLVKAALGA
ncbi:MAG: GatB/YqeY domain-containing protein [bacterium]|nr:GatB/YqeY domain-containing protein [bacterium]